MKIKLELAQFNDGTFGVKRTVRYGWFGMWVDVEYSGYNMWHEHQDTIYRYCRMSQVEAEALLRKLKKELQEDFDQEQKIKTFGEK